MLSDARLSCIKKYLSHVPNKVSDNAFLFARFAKTKWGNMVLQKGRRERNFRKCGKENYEKVQFDGHYTNHSIRRSCATRLLDGGVPELLIQETTGHRSSDGVRAYKCTSSALQREASEILQGSLSKKAVTDVEKKDENGAGENYIAREVKVVSPGKSDQEGSNQSVVVSTNSTRIVNSFK